MAGAGRLDWPAWLLRVRFAEAWGDSGTACIFPTSRRRMHSWERSGALGIRIPLGDTRTGCSNLWPSFRSISSNPDWKPSLRTPPSRQRCVLSFVTAATRFGIDRAQKNVPTTGSRCSVNWEKHSFATPFDGFRSCKLSPRPPARESS